MNKLLFAFSGTVAGLVLAVLSATAAASTLYSFNVALTNGETIGGETIIGFQFPALSDAGDVASVATFKKGQITNSGVIRSFGGTKSFLAKQGDVLNGQTVTGFGPFLSLNSAGTVAYSAVFPGFAEGVFTQNGKIAATGDTIDGKLLTYAASPSINNGGSVAYNAGYAGTSGVFTNNHLVVGGGDTVSGRVLTSVATPDFNDPGQVSMTALFSGGRAVYLNGALVVATGDTISGKTIDEPGNPSLNNAGNMVVAAGFNNGAGAGLFTKDSLLVSTGVTIDGKTLTGIGTPSWNDAEQILFPATYSGVQGYFMYDHGALSSIANIGMAIDGSTVTNLTPGSFDINESGQIGFSASLADGRAVYVIATPVPEPASLLSAILGLLAICSRPMRPPRPT